MGMNPPKSEKQHCFSDEEIRPKAYEISKSHKATGTPEGDWDLAIKALKLELCKPRQILRHILRPICAFLWRMLNKLLYSNEVILVGEIKKLDELATKVIGYLLLGSLVSFGLGFSLLAMQDRLIQFLAMALLGFSGSAVAALTSCLNRYATGFELEDGTKVPTAARGETFNRRMSRWFFVRPFLGFVVAPVLIWGVGFFVKDPQQYKNSTESLAFTAFLGGLLAKSVLELIKDLFKNVFKV